MRISDQINWSSKIMKIHPGQDMAEIIVEVGDQAVTATITAGAYGDWVCRRVTRFLPFSTQLP